MKDEQDSATYPCHTPLLKNMMIHKDVNIGVVEKMYIYNPTSPFLNAYISTLSLEMQVLEEYANSATDSYSGQEGIAEPLMRTHNRCY